MGSKSLGILFLLCKMATTQFLFLDFYVYVCLSCLYASALLHAMPVEVRRRHQIPRNWSYRSVVIGFRLRLPWGSGN